jgi:hypothetical protein
MQKKYWRRKAKEPNLRMQKPAIIEKLDWPLWKRGGFLFFMVFPACPSRLVIEVPAQSISFLGYAR